MVNNVVVDVPPASDAKGEFDDDGRVKRTGTMFTASAHIITAVIGSGVLSLAWAIAQLGWIAGPVAILAFASITWYMTTLLADCYRSPDSVTGRRNYTYMDAVKNILGGTSYRLCGVAQYINLIGFTIGYIIAASTSLAAVKRSNCFHKKGHNAGCHTSNDPFMIMYGVSQVILSQLPNFHKLWFLSIVAAVMSFAYASIGVGLSIAQIAEGENTKTSITGTVVGVDVTVAEKVWNSLQALGNIAFAYVFSAILIEIQDTLKSSPPENKVMKKATLIGFAVTTFFYLLCGLLGYAAFGNKTPGNFLTGFGFYEPYWLVDFANVCLVVHLLGAYQVFSQPTYAFLEHVCSNRWPESDFVNRDYNINIPMLGVYPFNFLRLVWRTSYVVLTTFTAMLFPFFNDFVGLIGAAAFWPVAVHFPSEMYIKLKRIPKFGCRWLMLKLISAVCLSISLMAIVASIQGLIEHVTQFKPLESVS